MNNLLLSKEIYKRELIEETILQFREICSITVEDRDGYFICWFSKCAYPVELTICEFENYLIDLTSTRKTSD